MNSNFSFLQNQWSIIFEEAKLAEQNTFTAPRTSVFYARRSIELIIDWLYEYDSDLRKPYDTHLSALMFEPSFKQLLPKNLFHLINFIRKIGNQAVHSRQQISNKESLRTLRNLYLFAEWFAKQYSEEQPKFSKYDESIIPKEGKTDKNAEELLSLQKEMELRDKKFEKQKKLIADYQEQLELLQQRVKTVKEENVEYLPKRDYSEAETRTLFIDLLLKEAGWNPQGENVAEYEVSGMPNNKGIGFVDYVLWGDDGLPLALVEAKRTTVSSEKGQRQAELYANSLEKMHGQRPIIFYTNGYDHWIWDDTMYPPRPVQGFYTKDQLQTLINRRDLRKDLDTAKINDDIAGRYYQKLAIKSVLEQFSQKNRQSLLVMATGSGKTRTSIALVEILMKHNWIKNVLFLADRTALLKQAKNNFNNLLPQASTVNITEDKEDNTSRIVFSTYPTMMNVIDEANKSGQKRFGVGHFDLIIIDEAHRSVYHKYRAIFEYFDSMLFGLTATPKSEIDRNTYELFGLEDHNPTYAYELEQAVSDGFLVPPKQISVKTKFMSEGLTYDELSDEEKEEYEMTFEDDEGQLPLNISASNFNDWVFNKNTVDQVLANLMQEGIKVEGGDRLGKTIIFAKKHSHAQFIAERFNKNYPQYGGKTLRVIDNHVKYAQSLIDEFSKNDSDSPMIAVSVDMLDTGIDIPELVNLVFFKVVRSKSKFWQMIGRGTRLCPNLFGPDQDKTEFVIFDFCGNFDFFNVNPEGIEGAEQKPISQQIFERRVDLVHELQSGTYLQDENAQELRNSLTNILYEDVKQMDGTSFSLRPYKRHIDEFSRRDRWNNLTNNDVMDLKDHVAQFSNLVTEDDEFARRFDLLSLNLQLELIKPKKRKSNTKTRLQTLAKLLEEKANIPAVANKISTIRQITDENFFSSAKLEDYETVRKDLRELIKLLDPPDRKAVYTNFSDVIYYDGDKNNQTVLVNGNNLINYKRRVQSIIQDNSFHPIIQKIRNNEQLTHNDISELEKLILESDNQIKKEELEEVFQKEPVGVFIRGIVGLEREAAKVAFSDFMQHRDLNPSQLQFIDAVINHIVKTGIMKPAELYEQPFVFIHDQGVDGLFETSDKDQLFNILSNIRQNAQFRF